MRILLDTNVLISAIVFRGRTGALLSKLFDSEHELYISEFIDQEFKDKLEQKWPEKAEKAYTLLHEMAFHFCNSSDQILGDLRDQKDIQVLSDAIYHHIDLILTGDNDFLESDLEYPLVYSPSMMLAYLEKDN